MKPEPNIWIEDKTFALAEVLESGFEANFATEFAKDTILFIQQWHSGRLTFSQKTSGSTGIPKIIEISCSQMLASALGTIKFFELSHQDTVLLCLDSKYIAGKMMIVRALVAGMNLVCIEPDGNPLLRLPALPEVNFVAMVPLQMYNYVEGANGDQKALGKIKAIILGGGRVDIMFENRLKNVPVPIYATFGMTETVSHVALRRLNGAKPEAAYTLLPDIEMQKDDRGCLMLRGAVTSQAWIVSNDLVDIVSSSRFQWQGRYDTVINTGGIKVIPEKVEWMISSNCPAGFTNNFFVGGFIDSKYGEMVCLFVEGSLDENLFLQLIGRLKSGLQASEIPKKYIQVPTFIYTNNRKLNRIETIKSCVQSS